MGQSPSTLTGGQTSSAPRHCLHGDAPPSHCPLIQKGNTPHGDQGSQHSYLRPRKNTHTLMDSSRPPWACPFSARTSSSRPNVSPSMLWERLCSSSLRLSSRAARVRSYNRGPNTEPCGTPQTLYCSTQRDTLFTRVLLPPDGRSSHSCSRLAQH